MTLQKTPKQMSFCIGDNVSNYAARRRLLIPARPFFSVALRRCGVIAFEHSPLAKLLLLLLDRRLHTDCLLCLHSIEALPLLMLLAFLLLLFLW